MSNLPESVQEARVRTLMVANLLLASATMLAKAMDWGEPNARPARLAIAIAIVFTCSATLLLVRKFPQRISTLSVLTLQAIVLASPWITGGIRRPTTYLEIPLLLLSSFLFGSRISWGMAISFGLNTAAVAWCETHGIILSSPPSEQAHLLLLIEATAFGLYFVAKPLGLTQRLLAQARENNARHLGHQRYLSQMNEVLDARIAEREKELLALRNRLTHSTEVLSSTYEPIIQRITVRARYIQEALKTQDETVQFPVERILAGCDRLTRMHKAISRFSRLGPQSLVFRDLDPEAMRSMVRLIWDEIRLAYPRAGHRLFLNEFSGCRADPDMLRQVWQHVLSNAAKFSARQPKPRIVVGWKHGEFYVNDNGVGFDSTKSENLFEIFSRMHSAEDFPGDGIGLASAKRIVELHQGSIRVESQSGKGATFFFKLP